MKLARIKQTYPMEDNNGQPYWLEHTAIVLNSNDDQPNVASILVINDHQFTDYEKENQRLYLSNIFFTFGDKTIEVSSLIPPSLWPKYKNTNYNIILDFSFDIINSLSPNVDKGAFISMNTDDLGDEIVLKTIDPIIILSHITHEMGHFLAKRHKYDSDDITEKIMRHFISNADSQIIADIPLTYFNDGANKVTFSEKLAVVISNTITHLVVKFLTPEYQAMYLRNLGINKKSMLTYHDLLNDFMRKHNLDYAPTFTGDYNREIRKYNEINTLENEIEKERLMLESITNQLIELNKTSGNTLTKLSRKITNLFLPSSGVFTNTFSTPLGTYRIFKLDDATYITFKDREKEQFFVVLANYSFIAKDTNSSDEKLMDRHEQLAYMKQLTSDLQQLLISNLVKSKL